MTEPLEREIRTLRELYWSDRDPDGRGFAPLADAYRRSGEVQKAIAVVGDGLDRLPGFASGLVVAARVYCDAGMLEKAVQAARRALEVDAGNVEALRSLSAALDGRGETGEARKVRRRLDELVVEVPGLDGVGQAPDSVEEGPTETDAPPETDAPSVGALSDDALAAAIHDPLPTRTLADLYARQGLTEQALSVYRQLLEVTPTDTDLRYRIDELSTRANQADTEGDRT